MRRCGVQLVGARAIGECCCVGEARGHRLLDEQVDASVEELQPNGGVHRIRRAQDGNIKLATLRRRNESLLAVKPRNASKLR